MSEIKEKSEEQVLQEKKMEFLKEYGELVTKFKMDFATYPVWIPGPNSTFQTLVQSTVVVVPDQPVESNFIADESAR